MLRQDSPRIALATAAVDTAHLFSSGFRRSVNGPSLNSWTRGLIQVFAAQPTWYHERPALTPSLSCSVLSHLAHSLRFISFSTFFCFGPSHEFYFSRVKILRTERPFIHYEHQIERSEHAQNLARRLVVLDDVTGLKLRPFLICRRHRRTHRSRPLA